MMMRWVLPVLLVAAVAGMAEAHPQVVTIDEFYVVTNDGKTWVSEETNGESGRGMNNLSPIPSLAGTTGLQAHDVCYDIYDEAEVDDWQPGDPFYGYIPWQAEIAGTGGEDSAAWIAFWIAKLGVDLTQVADLSAECDRQGGTFVGADTFVVGPIGSPAE